MSLFSLLGILFSATLDAYWPGRARRQPSQPLREVWHGSLKLRLVTYATFAGTVTIIGLLVDSMIMVAVPAFVASALCYEGWYSYRLLVERGLIRPISVLARERYGVWYETHPRLWPVVDRIAATWQVLRQVPRLLIIALMIQLRAEWQRWHVWLSFQLAGMASAIFLLILVTFGWDVPSLWIGIATVLPLLLYVSFRLLAAVDRGLSRFDRYHRRSEDTKEWVRARPDSISGWVAARIMLWLRVSIAFLAGAIGLHVLPIPYGLWPSVAFGPAVLVSLLHKRRTERRNVRWLMVRLYPWVSYTSLVLWLTAAGWWSGFQANASEALLSSWWGWVLAAAVGLVLVPIFWLLDKLGETRLGEAVTKGHKVGLLESLGVALAMYAAVVAAFRLLVLPALLTEFSLAVLLNAIAPALAGGLTLLTWVVIFTQVWLVNPLEEAGLLDENGFPIFNKKMTVVKFSWPVINRWAGLWQLLFHVHPMLPRTHYLYLLNPLIGNWDGRMVKAVLGIDYQDGERWEDLTEPGRFKNWLVVQADGPFGLGWATATKWHVQLDSPAHDLTPSFWSWFFDCGKHQIQAVSMGEHDLRHILPVRFRGSKCKSQDPYDGHVSTLHGEQAHNLTWFYAKDEAATMSAHKKGLETMQHRAPVHRQQQEQREAGRRPRVAWHDFDENYRNPLAGGGQ